MRTFGFLAAFAAFTSVFAAPLHPQHSSAIGLIHADLSASEVVEKTGPIDNDVAARSYLASFAPSSIGGPLPSPKP